MSLTGQIMIGPMNVKDAQPLPSDLEEFISKSGDNGFIICSFGSMVASSLQREKVDMLAAAFGKLKQRVVWRIKGINFRVIENVFSICSYKLSELLLKKSFISSIDLFNAIVIPFLCISNSNMLMLTPNKLQSC